MNPSDFQRMFDDLIRAISGHDVTSYGMMIGEDKTTMGTPDSYYRDNDLLVLIEETTEKNGLGKKLKNDVKKCLDESKTGISKSKIKKIILAYNSRLSVKDTQSIVDCYSDIRIEFFDIDGIVN